MVNKQVVHTFQLSDEYFGTCVGCIAYSTDGTLNHSYIYLTIYKTDSEYSTYRYDPSTTITTVTTCYNNSYTWSNPRINHFGTKDCAVLFIQYDTLIIYNPNNPDTSTTYTGMQSYQSTLRYINGGKQLILGGSTDTSNMSPRKRVKVVDIGLLLHDGTNLINATNWFPVINDSTYIRSFVVPYDKGIITTKRGSTNTRELIYVPIEKCVPHYAKIRTRTIQSYNNPISVQGITLEDCFTNIIDRTQPV